MAKTYLRRIIFILLLSGLFPTGVSATPLGSVTSTIDVPDHAVWHDMFFYISLTDDDILNHIDPVGDTQGFPFATLDPVFLRYNLTLSDIGYTFAINQSNYESWDILDDHVLTDGDQDLFAHCLGLHDSMAPLTDWNFSPTYAGNGIDFQGYIINNLLLTIDDIQVQESYPGYDQLFDWTVTWTLTVDGQSLPVPEPTTLLLFGTGIAGLVGARIRKKATNVRRDSL